MVKNSLEIMKRKNDSFNGRQLTNDNELGGDVHGDDEPNVTLHA